MVSIFTIFATGTGSFMHFRKIGMKSGIYFRKIGTRNGYVFETSMERPHPKYGQIPPPPPGPPESEFVALPLLWGTRDRAAI